MGCGAIDVKDSGLKDLELSSIQNMDLDLKNSLIFYITPKIPKFIKIGLYIDTIYHKKRGLEKIIKYSQKRFFIINDTKKSFNHEILVTKFLEKFPQFSKNNDNSKKLNAIFSPNDILTDNYSNIFKSLKIEVNNKNNFAICFINEKENDANLLSKLKLIKEKFDKNFYIYKINNKEDPFAKNEQYTFFFRENKINFWVENDLYNSNCFNSLLNYYKFQNKINNNDIEYLMNKDTIKDYLIKNSKAEDEYIIKNKCYEFYGKDGSLTAFNDFPTFILMQNPIDSNEQFICVSSKQKININNYITNEIKKINTNIIINKIEVFKERMVSFLLRHYFVLKKKYTLYFNAIEQNILKRIIEEINEKINLNIRNINNNYSIENIIITPKINIKFNLYEENKRVYIIINYSTCIQFVKKKLYEQYGEIYGYDTIKFICIHKDNHDLDLNILLNDNDEIKFLNEKEIMKDNNIVEFYIHSFNPINYFSHILIIVNQEGIIQYVNHFKNRAAIFYNYLKENNLNIKESLPLIDVNNFKDIKIFFKDKMKALLDKITVNESENIIDFCEENFFQNYYKKNIYYQPYLSLKYNKINNLENKNEKKYKNYSLNYINFQDVLEIPFNEKEHNPLNEISHIYYEKEAYIQNKKELRCKDCCAKLPNIKKYIFYFCPISKDVICEKCHKKNGNYEASYPFNLLYINCKNRDIFDNMSKGNISLFRDRIKYEQHPEIMDEICDMCSRQLCNYENKSFNVLVNIIRKNNFLICNNCFDLLNDEERTWTCNNKYSYIKDLILNNFLDLDNLIFKKVKFN